LTSSPSSLIPAALTDISGDDYGLTSSPTLAPLSPLTNISDDEDINATYTYAQHSIQDVDLFIINTNFNPYLEENRMFPCGRSKEDRLQFTKEDRENVKKHLVTPLTLVELESLVC
jgi:hypothetical protein